MTTTTIRTVIQARDDQTPDIAVLELAPVQEGTLPPFSAGAHVDVRITDDITRQYSLCGDPASDSGVYRLGILKDPDSRGGSVAVHKLFQPGVEVAISEPRNQFPLEPAAAHTVLFGGGIGITPMIAMAYALRRDGQSFELHYSVRSTQSAAFLDELAREFPEQFSLHPDDGDAETRLSPEQVVKAPPDNTHVYVCGPEGYMNWVIESAQAAGLAEAQIHREYFNADVDQSGGSFEVVAQASGKTVRVAEGQSIADALKEAGIYVEVSCEQGVCGTCITEVIEGTPDHRDHFLSEEEKEDNEEMAVCCSRAKSDRLVLDI